jgi:hypothetical protein
MRQRSRPFGRSSAMTGAVLATAVLLTGCLAGATHQEKSGPGDGGSAVALLADTRLARNAAEGGFDRFVLEFENQVPEWRVRYVTMPVRESGSGDIVPLYANHAIEVWTSPASGYDFSGPGGAREVYTGPDRLSVGTPQITEVVRSGDFEATMRWAIGTRDHRPFRVMTLSDPPRLVVDVAHG